MGATGAAGAYTVRVEGNAPNSRIDDDTPARPSTGLDKRHAYKSSPAGWAHRPGSGRTQHVCTQSLCGRMASAALVLTTMLCRLLYDLEGQAERTDSKLAAATRRMNFFLQKAEGENKSL